MTTARLRKLLAALLLAGAAALTFASPAFAVQDEGGEEAGETEEISHAAEECIHTLEAGGEPDDCQEAPSPILPATAELVWGGIAFAIVFIGIAVYGYPAIKSGMEARTQRIRDNLDEADRTKADAQRILEEYQHQLADAKNESARIIEEARQTAEQMRRDLMARAESEVQELRARTQEDLRSAQDRAMADLRAQVAQLAVGAAEIVVQKNLDPETNRALVERYIEQVGSGASS